MICKHDSNAVHTIQVNPHIDGSSGQAAAVVCQPSEERLIMNNWSYVLNARVGNFWWKLENVHLGNDFTGPGMSWIQLLTYCKEWKSHESQCLNMSLNLNILNILFDSRVRCYALFILYYIVRVLSVITDLTMLPKETLCTKLEKRYHPGANLRQIFSFEIPW